MSYLKGSSIRIVLGIAGLFGVVFVPAWALFLILGLLTLRYPAWEALLIGLVADFLWLAPRSGGDLSGLFYSLPLFTIAAAVMVWGFEPLRREFLFGSRTLV